MGCFDKFLNPQLEHEMELKKILSGGTEEWFCQECGRRIFVTCRTKPPIVVTEGNDRVHHRYADVSRPKPASERHKKVLVRTHKSGAQEWICPTCERWSIRHEGVEIVLDQGNASAEHFTDADEPISPYQKARQAQEAAPEPDRLAPYRRRFSDYL